MFHAIHLLADVSSPRLVDRLDPHTRAQVVLALAALVILGLLMMGLTWLVFRALRRQFRRTDAVIAKQQSATSDDDWARKPLTDEPGDAT